MPQIVNVAVIGQEIAIAWDDGSEDYFSMERLRFYSPSAQNTGESDLFGKIHGGSDQTEFPNVTIIDWHWIGTYAIQFHFSDGHKTGIYSFEYLKHLAKLLESP